MWQLNWITQRGALRDPILLILQIPSILSKFRIGFPRRPDNFFTNL